MADGDVKIDLKLDDSKAKAESVKSGQQIKKGVESGLKGVETSAKTASKKLTDAFKESGKQASNSFKDVGTSAKSSFNNVGDAAKTASNDAASAFQKVPSDAKGAFSDTGDAAKSGFDGVADAAKTASSDAADAFEDIPDAAEDAAEATHSTFASKFPVAAAAAVAAVGLVSTKLLEVAGDAVKVGMEFDKSMSQVAATMGVTTSEIGELRDFAKEMGAQTAFSATQASEALNYMALAGYDAQTSMRVLPTVLNLAAAGSMDLASASDMVTDAQSALGLSVEEAETMVDQMAKTSSTTNTSVSQLGQAFLTVGGTAKNLAGGTAELSQMLGILADNGIKGAEGGTALRNVILSLSAPTDVAAKKIKELGLEVFDAEGNMRPMPDIIQDLNRSMEPLTQKEKTEALNTIFNKVDLKSVNALLGTSADRFDQVATSIDNAQGSAKKMAETQLDNLAGDVTLLQSAFEGLQIQISDAVAPVLRDIVKTVTNAVIPAFSKLVDNADKIVPVLAKVAAAFVIWKTYPAIIKAMSAPMKAYQAAVASTGMSVKSLTTAQKLNIVTTQAGTVATKAFAAASKMLATALPLIAITAAVEVISQLASFMEDAAEKDRDFAKATDGLKDAFNQVDKAAVDSAKALNTYSTDKPRRSMNELRDSINETIKAQGELADSIAEDWQGINTDSALVEQYVETIKKLTNAYDENGNKRELYADEQAALISAVAGYNEITGESVNVIDAVNGVLDQSTEKLNANAEAWINNARKQAAQEEIVALQREQVKMEKDLGEATTAYTNAQELRNKAAQAGLDITEAYTEAQVREITEAEKNYHDLNSVYQENAESIDYLMGVMSDADNQLRSSSEAISEYINSRADWSSALNDIGVDIDAFSQKLSELGFSTADLAKMSGEQLTALANSYQLSTDEIIAVCDNMGIEVPEKLRQVGVDSVDGLAEGLSSEQQAAIDAALEVAGLTHDEFQKLVDEAGITGADATVEYAEGIASEKQKSQSAAQLNSTVALEGFKSEDMTPAGDEAGGQYVSGIEGASSDAENAGKTDAQAAGTGMKSENGNAKTWGLDLGKLFADGINAAKSFVSNAANAIAGVVKGILGHSVPKEGILREGGEGEAKWGRHLVQNIAEGMREGQSDIKDAADETAEIIDDAFEDIKDSSPWEDVFKVDDKLIRGLKVDFSSSGAFGNLSDTLKGNMSLMTNAASNVNTTYDNKQTTVNINQPVQSPAQFAREIRKMQTFGLAALQ